MMTVKMPAIVSILTFISRKKGTLDLSKAEKC